MPADARPAPIELGTWPTPVEPAPRLAAAIGLAADDLWIKRDDLTGLGGGGNKLRKLRYTAAQALAAGAAPRASSSTRPTRRGRWPAWPHSSPVAGSSPGTVPFFCIPAGCLACSAILGSRA